MTSTVRPMHDDAVDAPGDALVIARRVNVAYARRRGGVRLAVDGVDLDIRRGETLGLLGESGCGKTSLAKALLGLTAVAGGEVHFDGCELSRLERGDRMKFRRRAQMIFQDAAASLNPRIRVHELVGDPLKVHGGASRRDRRAQVDAVLAKVGLDAGLAERLPRDLSGGERQRVALARALVLEPELIVCDEPVSALDASARVRLLDLLAGLCREQGCALLFITHDPSAAQHICSRIAVMFAGRIVEIGPAGRMIRQPRHPYTLALWTAVPRLDPAETSITPPLATVLAEPSDRREAPPPGCAYRLRCPFADDRCKIEAPVLAAGDNGEHPAACFYPKRIHAEQRYTANGAFSLRDSAAP